MTKLVFYLGVLLIVACKHAKKEPYQLQTTESNSSVAKEETRTEFDLIKQKLNGKWKRIDYPFSTIEFRNGEMKIVEEGSAEAPAFENFEIAASCANETTKTAKANSNIYFIRPKYKGCREIILEEDTLILLNDIKEKKGYKIVYNREN